MLIALFWLVRHTSAILEQPLRSAMIGRARQDLRKGRQWQKVFAQPSDVYVFNLEGVVCEEDGKARCKFCHCIGTSASELLLRH